jgi:hypothetical protein
MGKTKSNKKTRKKGTFIPYLTYSVLIVTLSYFVQCIDIFNFSNKQIEPPVCQDHDDIVCKPLKRDKKMCRTQSQLQKCPMSCGLCSDKCKRYNNTPAFKDSFKHMIETALDRHELQPTLLSSDPPIVLFDNFLTDNEMDGLINACPEYIRSIAGHSISQSRTSSQCWCYADCMNNPIIGNALKKVHEVTHTNPNNAEYMQLLKYEKDQYYKKHHDQNSAPDTPQGPRIFTFFMYLNTPSKGGETTFPSLDVTVQPKAGRAILWPSVLETNMTVTDKRTYHEAMPVLDGIKYGANVWIHLYDWKTPSQNGCFLTSQNTFDDDN